MTLNKNSLLYAGLFIVSASLLMFEIVTTRATKIAFGHNFQFVILSLAILGIGIGGMAVYFFLNKLMGKKVMSALMISAILFTGLILLPFLIIHYSNVYPGPLIKILFFIFSFLFYLVSGIYISLIFRY